MEYKKEYRSIRFRVVYSIYRHAPRTITFAAQPYEALMEMDKDLTNEPSTYLIYGKVEIGEHLEVGFKGFTFKMTQEFHSRLGLLYKKVLQEYKSIILKKT